jgi:hypothetical protein
VLAGADLDGVLDGEDRHLATTPRMPTLSSASLAVSSTEGLMTVDQLLRGAPVPFRSASLRGHLLAVGAQLRSSSRHPPLDDRGDRHGHEEASPEREQRSAHHLGRHRREEQTESEQTAQRRQDVDEKLAQRPRALARDLGLEDRSQFAARGVSW